MSAPDATQPQPSPSTAVAPSHPGRGRAFRLLCDALVVLALIHPLATLLARRVFLADLATHFREAAIVVTLAAAAGQFGRRRLVAAGLVGLASCQAWGLIPFYWPNPVVPDPARPARLRVLASNVLVSNQDRRPLAELIRRERPDVVGLIEVTKGWIEELEDVRRDYPYRYEYPGGSSGLALWFREEPTAVDPPAFPLTDDESWPYLRARFEFDGVERTLWLVHPQSPIRRFGVHRGNPELAALAGRVAAESGSRIVIGDLNTTENSPHFGEFFRATGLRDSRLGFGRQPTWHAALPYRIAIDHALVSDDLAVANRRVGPSVSSDHLPLILDLAPAQAGLR